MTVASPDFREFRLEFSQSRQNPSLADVHGIHTQTARFGDDRRGLPFHRIRLERLDVHGIEFATDLFLAEAQYVTFPLLLPDFVELIRHFELVEESRPPVTIDRSSGPGGPGADFLDAPGGEAVQPLSKPPAIPLVLALSIGRREIRERLLCRVFGIRRLQTLALGVADEHRETTAMQLAPRVGIAGIVKSFEKHRRCSRKF